MAWAEWVNSDYNIDGYIVTSSYNVATDVSETLLVYDNMGGKVSSSEIIVATTYSKMNPSNFEGQ